MSSNAMKVWIEDVYCGLAGLMYAIIARRWEG